MWAASALGICWRRDMSLAGAACDARCLPKRSLAFEPIREGVSFAISGACPRIFAQLHPTAARSRTGLPKTKVHTAVYVTSCVRCSAAKRAKTCGLNAGLTAFAVLIRGPVIVEEIERGCGGRDSFLNDHRKNKYFTSPSQSCAGSNMGLALASVKRYGKFCIIY